MFVVILPLSFIIVQCQMLGEAARYRIEVLANKEVEYVKIKINGEDPQNGRAVEAQGILLYYFKDLVFGGYPRYTNFDKIELLYTDNDVQKTIIYQIKGIHPAYDGMCFYVIDIRDSNTPNISECQQVSVYMN